jgi:hypothetical protein
MAKYRREEIVALSNRLEARAVSKMRDQPEAARDEKAAALLLRLMLHLSDVVTVETSEASQH